MKYLTVASALCALVLAGCSGSGAVNPNATVVMTAGDTFSPVTALVSAGGTVTWTNNDPTDPHTVTADSGGGPDSNTAFPAGLTSAQQFQFVVPGGTPSGTNFYYHCSFHGTAGNGTSFGTGMVGRIIVR